MSDDGDMLHFKEVADNLQFYRDRVAQEDDPKLRELARYDSMVVLGLALLSELKQIKIALNSGEQDA